MSNTPPTARGRAVGGDGPGTKWLLQAIVPRPQSRRRAPSPGYSERLLAAMQARKPLPATRTPIDQRLGQDRAPDRGAARGRLRLAALDAGVPDIERERSEGRPRAGERGAGAVQGAGVECGSTRPAPAREGGSGSGLDAGGAGEGGDGGEAVAPGAGQNYLYFCPLAKFAKGKAGRERDSRPAFSC